MGGVRSKCRVHARTAKMGLHQEYRSADGGKKKRVEVKKKRFRVPGFGWSFQKPLADGQTGNYSEKNQKPRPRVRCGAIPREISSSVSRSPSAVLFFLFTAQPI